MNHRDCEISREKTGETAMRIYQADVLIDGSGEAPQRNVEIIVNDQGVIQDIAPAGSKERPADTPVYPSPGKTALPGFIDVHVHLMFGEAGRSYRDVWHNDSDLLMALRGPRNAYIHLRSGVTTLRDAGAVRDVGFAIKEAAEAGHYLTPRMLVSGRPLTITGGHFWWCGQEADGVDGVRQAVREMVKKGADFIKIMASGGGTVGTDGTRASYSVEELKAIVDEAHQFGLRTAAHCIAAEAVRRAAEAGVDEIEHFNFMYPDGSRVWDQSAADMILEKGLFVSPTIQTGWRRIEQLQKKEETGTLTAVERRQLEAGLYKTNSKLEFIGRFHDMGVSIAAGTDSISKFGDYAIGLELLHRAGLSPMDVIMSATSVAAKSIGMENKVGMVRPGMLADLVYIDGDPLADIATLGQVAAVVLNGQLVVDKQAEEAVDLSPYTDSRAVLSPIPGC
jgi:imidazolonepropionase-like amidohydrolase